MPSNEKRQPSSPPHRTPSDPQTETLSSVDSRAWHTEPAEAVRSIWQTGPDGLDESAVKRLERVPGIGVIIATAMIAMIEDARNFKNGRELAAWIGLVPRQHSTGGKQILPGIIKRDDAYLRKLLIHGARALTDHAFATALDQHGELDRAGDGARVRTG